MPRLPRKVLLAGALPVAAALGGFLFAWSGLYDIGARKGHWAITRALLGFAMESSVRTHAARIAVPPLDDPALIYLGFGHYEGACVPCHGGPGERPNPITQALVPRPPALADRIADWEPNELFWIVKNGLKYTAMPAWPAPDRDDEVWAVVAALLRLPELTPEEYRTLLRTDTFLDASRIEEDARLIATAGTAGDDLVACARCHGLTGAGGGAGAFPRLNGLSAAYLHDALRRYAIGERQSGIMQPIAVELSDDEMAALARYFAAGSATPAPLPSDADPEVMQRGERVAARGVPADGVAACAPCHGPGRPVPHPLYPPLAGQHTAYLRRQLEVWRDGRSGTSPLAAIMHAAVRGISDEDIAAVALYYTAAGHTAVGERSE